MRKIIFAFIMLAAAPGFAESPSQLYKQGKYEKALAKYLKMDMDNPFVLYNAGNCFFNLDKKGKSVLYYARAFKLMPRNSNIRQNLIFALSRTGQSLVPKGMPQIVHVLFYFLSENEIKAFAYVSFWLLALSAFLISVKPGFKGKLLRPSLYLAAFFSFFTLWGVARANSFFSGASVLIRNARIMSGPGGNFKVRAKIPEGRLIKLTGKVLDDYMEAGLPDEKIKGWVKKDAVEKI